MNVLRYRDYQGEVEFDEDKLIIRLLHIDDLITTEVDSASEAQAAFVELVDDYVASCIALGKEPGKPFKGSFNVRVPPGLHKQAAFMALEEGETLNSFVVSAMEEKLHADQDKLVTTEKSAKPNPGINWNGFLRFSLVTCPITLIPATPESEVTWVNRVSQADPLIVDIDQFVPRSEIDYLYLANPFYIVPEGGLGHDAYVVIREAIRSLNTVAIARVVLPGSEHVFAVEARDNGLVGTLVRRPSEVRDSFRDFSSIQDVRVTKDMLELAKHIVEKKLGRFDPEKFWDIYKVAPGEPLTKNQRGKPGAGAVPPTGSNIINLMEALRASLERNNQSRIQRKSTKDGSAKPARKS